MAINLRRAFILRTSRERRAPKPSDAGLTQAITGENGLIHASITPFPTSESPRIAPQNHPDRLPDIPQNAGNCKTGVLFDDVPAIALVHALRQRRYDKFRSSDIDNWLSYVGRSAEWFDTIADSFRSPRVWARPEEG